MSTNEGEILLQKIIKILGRDKFLDTLLDVSFWARIGDPVWTLGLVTVYINKNPSSLVSKDEEIQGMKSRFYQTAVSKLIGLDAVWVEMYPQNEIGDRTFSELLEAVIGRLYFEKNNTVPLKIIQEMMSLVQTEPCRVPTKKILIEKKEYSVKFQYQNQSNLWKAIILDKDGKAVACGEAKKAEMAATHAVAQLLRCKTLAIVIKGNNFDKRA